MNVLNRNMFRNRDSRNRLAQMGGILSSSPELQETAMTFANGGGADLDTKFILTNIPELGIREGQFVKISGKTLEGLNNAIPEVMARHGDKVKSVELMMDERNSALVALAREGDALIGTRVNRLLEQRATDSAAASDVAPVSIPSDMSQISSAADVFAISRAPSTEANIARDDRVARSIAAASNEDLTIPAQLRADPPQANDAAVLAAQKRRFEDAAAAAANSARLMAERGMLNNSLESGIAKAVPTDTDKLLEVASSILSDEQKEAIASGKISDRAKALLPEISENASNTEAFVRESKPNPFAVTSSPVVTPSEELISVTPEVKKEVTSEVTETVEDNTGFVSVTLNPGTISMSVFDFNPTTGELRPRGGNADLMLSGSPRAEANVQQMVLDQYNLDTKIEPVVKAKAEAEQAQKVFEANETGVNLTEAGDAARKLREAEAAVETTATPSAVEQVLSRKTPFKDVPYGLDAVEEEQLALREKEDYSGQVESGTAKQSSTRPPSFRRNADGVFITDDTQDSAEDLLKELSAERATNEQEQLQVEKEEEGDRKVVSPPAAPKITPAVTEKITTLGANAGMGEKFGGDGSIADLTKDYTKLLKSLLGESDEDKAARKGELFMLMGAALMSGKSSNALTNIGGALQIGAKAAIQDRVTRKKRDDTIGLKGFELAADRIAKREATEATIAAEGRAFKRDKLLLVERLKNAKNLAEFNSELGKTYIKSGPYKSLLSEYKQARETFDDLGADISKEDRELGFANYFTKRMLQSGYDPLDIQTFNLYQGRNSLPSGTDGGGQSLDDIT